jgi:hypothetical protein
MHRILEHDSIGIDISQITQIGFMQNPEIYLETLYGAAIGVHSADSLCIRFELSYWAHYTSRINIWINSDPKLRVRRNKPYRP